MPFNRTRVDYKLLIVIIIPCEIESQMIVYKSDSLSPAGDNHSIIPGLKDNENIFLILDSDI